jgi:serine/threonine protein kinase
MTNDNSPTVDIAPIGGQYSLLHSIGQGGGGVLWRARDVTLDREVAVKVIQVPASESAEVASFLREARIAARLNHPNTVAVHHVLLERSEIYIVMEYVRGSSLQDLLAAAGPTSWRDATLAIRDAAAGLAAAHAAGMVHRDIKPANLLRTEQGTVKVADFGIALGQQDVLVSAPGTISGTPDYISPEQCEGKSVDFRSDLYSLGCTYFALLTGRPPFEAETSQAVMYRHCHDPIPKLEGTIDRVPDGVARVIARLMQKDPEARFGSAEEIVAELDAILSSPERSLMYDGVNAVPAEEPASRSSRRRRRWWLLAAIVVVAVAAGIGIRQLVYRDAEGSRGQAAAPAVVSPPSTTPRAADIVAPGQWVDLLKGSNPMTDVIGQPWIADQKGNFYTSGLSVLVPPLRINGSYELEMSFIITPPWSNPRCVLPIGDSTFEVMWLTDVDGEKLVQLGLASGYPGTQRGWVHQASPVPVGTVFHGSIKVELNDATHGTITVSGEGKTICTWHGEIEKLYPPESHRYPGEQQLKIIGYSQKIGYSELRLRMLSGSAKWLRLPG